ncbi:MAG: hypothetical protein ABIP29_11440 [Candidatus Eisenbacteria bacterium]
MKDLRWIFAGALIGLAGVIALSISAAPSRPLAGTVAATKAAPVVAALPATPVVATTTVPAKSAPLAAGSSKAARAASSGIVPGSMGMMIAIDPETGEVGMPSPAQISEMNLSEDEAASHEDDGLTQVRSADGTVTVHLQGRYQEYAVIRKAADGTNVVGCVDHPAKADHVHPAAPAALEEK